MISEQRQFEIPVECVVKEQPYALRATIRAVRNGAFELQSPAALQPGQRLTMRHQERAIDSQVAFCKRVENGSYQIRVLMACDADRRSETRTPVDAPAMLRVTGSVTVIPVSVVDVSNSGLGLELPMAIPVGTGVHIDLSTGTAVGEIRHCQCSRTSDKFRAGVAMREFVLPPHARQMLLSTIRETGTAAALQSLMRTVQERQSRYEAILYSLALS